MRITAFDLAHRFIGIKELPGELENNPQIMAMLRIDTSWPQNDEVPWCGAFVEYIAWLLKLPRTKTLLARQWLGVGAVMPLVEAKAAWDVAIFKRSGSTAGVNDRSAPGHVGFYAGYDEGGIWVLGGNQSNAVNLSRYKRGDLLGIRRLKQWRS